MDDATGKVVLVTGAGQGCGRAIATDFAARGASVAVNDIDADTSAATTDLIAKAGGTAQSFPADVSVDEQVAGLVGGCVEAFGRLDIAVNNAGAEVLVPVAESTPDMFDVILATNLRGLRSCLVHEIAALRAGGGGSILNMSSVTSDLTAAPSNGLYAASKGGVDALTKSAAVEVASEGISINALAFIGADVENGMFQRYLEQTGTPEADLVGAIPAGRLLRREELCAAVRYLTCDDARFVVGTTFVLDGGFTSQ